jgi:hypothetical protein
MRFAAERGIGIQMTAQRAPNSRLIGQLRLLDAICEDIGVPRPPVLALRETYVTRDKSAARQVAERLWRSHVNQWLLHQNAPPVAVSSTVDNAQLPPGAAITVDDILERSPIGDPESVVEKLKEYESLGYSAFELQPMGLNQQDTLRSLELFGSAVMPHFPDSTPGPRPLPLLTREQVESRLNLRPPVLIDADGLPDGWVAWNGEEWLAHFDHLAATNGRRFSYVFDFSAPPKVHAHADGSIDNDDLLMLISDVGCPDCGRPIIAVYRRWGSETPAEMRQRLRQRMMELRWHERHTSRVTEALPTS